MTFSTIYSIINRIYLIFYLMKQKLFETPNHKKDMDLEGFQRFMDIYLEVETPRELIKRLFLSFVKKTISPNKISVGKHCVASQSVPEGTKLLTVCTTHYYSLLTTRVTSISSNHVSSNHISSNYQHIQWII